MSINMFDRELDNLKELLTMAMNAVIADSLEVETDLVHPDAQLVADLGMSAVTKRRLTREISFIFDCPEVELSNAMKVKQLVDHIANIEFSRLYPNLSAQVA